MDAALFLTVFILLFVLLTVLPISLCLRCARQHQRNPLLALFAGLFLSWLAPLLVHRIATRSH